MTNRIAMFPRATWLPLLLAFLALGFSQAFLFGTSPQKVRQIQTLTRLKKLGLEMQVYAEAHGGTPPSLQSREALLRALPQVAPSEAESAGWQLPFVTNPNAPDTLDDAERVVVYEAKALEGKPAFRGVLFADGHAKMVNGERWRELQKRNGIVELSEPSVARWWETGISGPKEPLPRELFGNALGFVALFWATIAAWLRARLCPQPVTAFFCALIIYAVFLPLAMLLIAVLISVTGSILGMIFSRFG